MLAYVYTFVGCLLALGFIGLGIMIRMQFTLGPKYPCTNSRCQGIWELHELVDNNCPDCGRLVLAVI